MTYENILNKLEGKWICQRTNYFLHNQKIIYDQSNMTLEQMKNINILEQKDNILYHYKLYNKKNNQKSYYLFFKQKQSGFGELHKITNDKIMYYRFKIYTYNCIKIESVQNNVVYYEYIYLINPKFKIIISVLKENQKYLAASFVTEIKISN
uniref:Chromophore lyase CpcS/CpeS homolog n=1 Tax=Gracilaria gracilis TaxID=2777 RepID=A0A345U7R8_GRAGA|nr:hypothetical protein [Gracilaria gracilis]AXI96504.1 hypothetical protein [Gracilaria gracilis]